MQVVLSVVNGHVSGQHLTFDQPEIVIGSDSSATTSLFDDPKLSGKHARLAYKSGLWFVNDLGSWTGTFVKGVRLGSEPVVIKSGETFTVGLSEIQLDYTVPPPISATPPIPFSMPKTHIAPPPIGLETQGPYRPIGKDLRDAMGAYEYGMDLALLDCHLTQEEGAQIMLMQQRMGLSDADTLPLRSRAFVLLTDQAIHLNQIDVVSLCFGWFSYLGLQHDATREVWDAMARATVFSGLTSLGRGVMPVMPAASLHLRHGEICHVEVMAKWLQGSGPQTPYGGSSLSSPPPNIGTLSLTNWRLAFVGTPNSFEMEWSSILAIDALKGGMSVHCSEEPNFATIQFSFPVVGELVSAVCSTYVG